MLIIDGLSKANIYPMAEANFTFFKWCFIYNSKSLDTIECRVHFQRSKPQLKCFNYEHDHLVKHCPKPKKVKEKPYQLQNKLPVYIQPLD